MKLYFRKFIYHWQLTGIVGKDGRWFLGFSKNISFPRTKELKVEQDRLQL